MAYSKTNWVDGVTPLSAGNLNKIEEGIATAVPTGAIVMWSGGYTDIPTGWALCDGLNGTPNLQDRFVMGATGLADHKTTGGANSVGLIEANLPSHLHGVGTLATASGGGHGHTASSNSTGSHGHTGTTGSAGGHTHEFLNFSYSGGGGTVRSSMMTTTSSTTSYQVGRTDTTGAHTHTLSIGADGLHSHTITIGSATDHAHAMAGVTGAVGSGTTHENRPAFYKLAFIMKI